MRENVVAFVVLYLSNYDLGSSKDFSINFFDIGIIINSKYNNSMMIVVISVYNHQVKFEQNL